MEKHSLFISDLHLQACYPETNEIFFKFIQETAPHADALYILGDFFEVWIGDDDNSIFNNKIKSVLKSLSDKGTAIYFMRGNRDFLMGKQFLKESKCRLLKDPTRIEIYNQPILLMHGDSLCSNDKIHLLFRKIAYNRCINYFFRILPLMFRRVLSKKIRNYSKKQKLIKPEYIMDVTQKKVIQIMQTYRVNLLIHGHTHKPDTHRLEINGQPATRIVLGAWGKRGNALAYYPDGSYKQLIF